MNGKNSFGCGSALCTRTSLSFSNIDSGRSIIRIFQFHCHYDGRTICCRRRYFSDGLAKMISAKILRMAGKSELKLFILVMLVTAAIGAFVSNTGTVALMLPIVVSLALSANMNASRLLMPLAFASSMGE